MIKAVIFDWGGVIAPNSNGGWMGVLMDILDISFDDLKIHWHAAGCENFSKGLIDEKTFWLQFEKSLNKPLPIDISRVWTDGGALIPYPGFIEFIQELKNKGILTAVLSNTVRPLSVKLRAEGLYDNFDVVILSDEVGLAKPNRSIYEAVVNRLGVLPEECIYIDDFEKNLVPARSMGMFSILATKVPEQTITKICSLL